MVRPLVAALLWLPQLRFRTVSAPGLASGAQGAPVASVASVWKASLAWQDAPVADRQSSVS